MEEDLREETQEEIQAEEDQEDQEARFQEDSWSAEETILEWQERCHLSSLEIALRQNSS